MSGERSAFADLVEIVRRLRAPDGCPWDRAQTHESLRRYALEESREVVVAIEEGRPEALRDELGDLLLQVLLHAVIAEQAGEFDLEAVLRGLADKLVRRHPHVFGTASADDPAAVERRWAEIKAEEAAARGAAGTASAARSDWLAAVPRHLGALAEAQALGQRAAEVGFDWAEPRGAWDKVGEEGAEFAEAWSAYLAAGRPAGGLRRAAENELGDLLLALVSVARLIGLDAEVALVSANAKFRRRFGEVEARVGPGGERLRAAGQAAMEAAWQEVKREEERGKLGG